MKRILAIAAATLALSANAQGIPQPSFMDYAPLEPGGNPSAGASTSPLSRGDFPTPSFVDYVAIEPEASSASGGVMLSRGELPQPSFQDYPESGETATMTASQGNLHARSK